MVKTYDNFVLLFSRDGNENRAKVIESPAGEGKVSFNDPFTRDEFDVLIAKLGDYSPGDRAAEDVIKDIGARLFDQVFKDQVYGLLRDSIARTQTRNKGLRILLRLTDAPGLADLPWEYLYDKTDNRFLALSYDTPIVRYLDVGAPVVPRSRRGPLRVLVMTSSPEGYEQLQVDDEWTRLSESLAEALRGEVTLSRVEATRSELLKSLDEEFHVLHFIGHGGFDAGGGYLVLTGENGRADRLYGEDLGRLLHDSRSSLRLVVLNACEGGRASVTDPFAGAAQSLLQAGLPAVVAMQFKIGDEAAITFATQFYSSIARYQQVDAALTEARKAIFACGNHIEWATPVLYMRSRDGAVFQPEPEKTSEAATEGLIYSAIVEAIFEGRLIPFLGPDANRCGRADDRPWEFKPGGVPPDDDDLAAYLADSFEMKTGDRLAKISQTIATVTGSNRGVTSKIRSVLAGPFEITPLHHMLASIPAQIAKRGNPAQYPLIVTSNHDDLLERAFREAGQPFDLIYYALDGDGQGRFYCRKHGSAEEHALAGRASGRATKRNPPILLDERTVILRLNGVLQRVNSNHSSCVITEDDFIDYMAGCDIGLLLPASVLGRLKGRDNHILFLGYAAGDWNWRVALRRLWGDGPLPPSWIVAPDSQEDDVEESFWTKRTVTPIRVSWNAFIDEMRRRLHEYCGNGGV